MSGYAIDFGDTEHDYDELTSRKVSRIPFLLELDDERNFFSIPSPDVARSMGVLVNKHGRVNEEQFKSTIITKLRSLDDKTVSFIVENTTYEEKENESIGFWRIRLDPRAPIFDNFVYKDHTLVLDCTRKKGRLKVIRISMQLVRSRPNPYEGLMTGIVSVVESISDLSSNSYFNKDDWPWLLGLPRRREELNVRLSEWEEYIRTYLDAIKNKQGWIAYRNLQRTNSDEATLEISVKHHSNNAKSSFFSEDELLVIDQEIPEKGDWKPNEDTKDPMGLGSLAKNIRIKEILESGGNKKDEWVKIKVDLNDELLRADEEVAEAQEENKPPDFKRSSKSDKLNKLPLSGLLVNSTLSDEIPFILQKKAIDRLREANSANPRLEDFLFTISEANLLRRDDDIVKDTLVEKNLNTNQQRALKTALNTPDLALIQGPPGTGKTTVIAELCNQVTLRGGRVLLASQSNLAVDNALSRLSNKSHIMPIRIGTRVTDEGEEFIEGNVVKRWFKSIRENTDVLIKQSLSLKTDFEDYRAALDTIESNIILNKKIIKELEESELGLERIKKDIDIQLDERDSISRKLTDSQENITTLAKCLKDSSIPNGDALYNIAKIYPEINSDIENINAIVLKPQFNNIRVDRTVALEIFSILSGVKRRDSPVDKHLTALQKLIGLSNACIINNEEINRLNNEKGVILSKIDSMTDPSEMASLTSQLISINNKIKNLKEASAENRLNEEWREDLIYLRTALDAFISIEKIMRYDLSSSPGSISELKGSFKPDSKFTTIIEKMLQVYKNISETPFTLTPPTVSDIQRIYSDLIANRNKLNESITIIDNKIQGLKEEEKATQSRIDRNTSSCSKVNKSIMDALSSLNGLRLKLASMENSEPATITLKDLDQTLCEDMKREYEKAMERQSESLKKGERWDKLKSEWVERIRRAEESESKMDYEGIKNIYIKLANVVGATCTETGKYKFWSNHGRDFDLVIIDEVSKATLPELLMPMLLGKQIVLVGDHNQLPPTFRLRKEELTYDEVKDDEDIKNTVKKYEKLVTSSYFEEMFLDANDEIKARLTEQYRMHPAIMNAINQFYPDDYQLVCGLKDPDNERKHGYNLKGKGCNLTSDDSHLVWVDSTWKKIGDKRVLNIEGRESGDKRDSKSRYNDYEVDLIEKILVSINSQFKPDGKTNKQKIAIISFYMGQIRKIKERYNQLKEAGLVSNLDVKIGTVDRFQGMERHVVIASLVSSPEQQGVGRRHVTSFVRDFRRINVALSRAQALLFAVGSADVFRDVPVYVNHEGQKVEKYCYGNIIHMAETGINGSCYVRGYELV